MNNRILSAAYLVIMVCLLSACNRPGNEFLPATPTPISTLIALAQGTLQGDAPTIAFPAASLTPSPSPSETPPPQLTSRISPAVVAQPSPVATPSENPPTADTAASHSNWEDLYQPFLLARGIANPFASTENVLSWVLRASLDLVLIPFWFVVRVGQLLLAGGIVPTALFLLIILTGLGALGSGDDEPKGCGCGCLIYALVLFVGIRLVGSLILH